VKRTLATTVALILAASFLPAHEAAVDVEAAKRAIRIADLEMAKAVSDRNLDRFNALVADDAVFFGRDVSRGREAVAKAWLPLFTDPSMFLKWQPDEVHVSASGDLGYSIGTYERRSKDPTGGPSSATGTYVSIWRKGADGKWRAVLDIGTPGTPVK
jgi:ketosteroid isomerase-like protein